MTSDISVFNYKCSLLFCCEIVANMNGYTFLHNYLEKLLFRLHGVNLFQLDRDCETMRF